MKLLVLIFPILLACSAREGRSDEQEIPESQILEIEELPVSIHEAQTEIIEFFVDSLNIGEKGKCKVELIKHRVYDNLYVIIKYFTKSPKGWNIQNTYYYDCDALMGLCPQISDFNGDDINDLTFISSTAARGANEVRRLFIYDQKGKELISIINSQSFPNMRYNRELNCVDAFLVHGGSTTVFARIEEDSLITFARIDCEDSIAIYMSNEKGQEQLLGNKQIIDKGNVYQRYVNYMPLKKYVE